jgi:hypothetical protein
MFCKLSSLEFAKLANFTPPLLPCRSVFTFKISLDQGRLSIENKGAKILIPKLDVAGSIPVARSKFLAKSQSSLCDRPK